MKFVNVLKLNSFIPGVILLAGMISGCSTASTDPVRVEADFGNSVKNMVDAQIIDHDAASAAYAEPVTGMSGARAEKVLNEHQSVESNSEAVKEPVDLQIK